MIGRLNWGWGVAGSCYLLPLVGVAAACGARDGEALAGEFSDPGARDDATLDVRPPSGGTGIATSARPPDDAGDPPSGVTPPVLAVTTPGAPSAAPRNVVPQPDIAPSAGATAPTGGPAEPLPAGTGMPVDLPPVVPPSDAMPPDMTPEDTPPDEPETMEETTPDDPEPELAPLWLAYSGGASGLAEVRADGIDVPSELAWDVVMDRPASSPDGRHVAVVVSDELAFVDLDVLFEQNPLFYPSNLTGEAPSMVTWGSGGILLRVGETELHHFDAPTTSRGAISTQLASGAWTSPSVSPTWTHLVYSSPVSGGYAVDWMPLPEGADPAHELLSLSTTPALDPVWSVDGNWWAFGLPAGDDPGIYLWRAGTADSPIEVTTDGSGYTPYYSFSPDGTRFSVHTGGYLTIVSLAEPTTHHNLGSGSASPGQWSRSGQYLTYFEGTDGRLAYVGQDGTPQAPVIVPGLEFDCVISWLDEASFIYGACGVDATPILRADVTSGEPPAVEVTELDEVVYPEHWVSPDGRCLATTDGNSLWLIDVAAGDAAQQLDGAALSNPRAVRWQPDGAGIAWLAGLGTNPTLHYSAVEGCTGTGTLFEVGVGSGASRLDFLNH